MIVVNEYRIIKGPNHPDNEVVVDLADSRVQAYLNNCTFTFGDSTLKIADNKGSSYTMVMFSKQFSERSWNYLDI